METMLNKKNTCKTNLGLEQREVLFNNNDYFIDAKNFKYQNMEQMYLIKVM